MENIGEMQTNSARAQWFWRMVGFAVPLGIACILNILWFHYYGAPDPNSNGVDQSGRYTICGMAGLLAVALVSSLFNVMAAMKSGRDSNYHKNALFGTAMAKSLFDGILAAVVVGLLISH
jgi:hypothetical protein